MTEERTSASVGSITGEATENGTEVPDEKYVRQHDIIPAKILETPITIIGAGAIGGTAGLFLAKTGFKNIRVYDDDKVELHNLPNSIYRTSDIGKPKVTALKEIIRVFEGIDIVALNKKFDKMFLNGAFICAVDSMETRHNIWRTIRRKASEISIYIDARMGAEILRAYAIDPTDNKDIKLYESTLCKPEDVIPLPCTAKATMYCASIAGGIVTSMLKQSMVEQKMDKKERKKAKPALREIVYDIAGGSFVAR